MGIPEIPLFDRLFQKMSCVFEVLTVSDILYIDM